MIYFCSGIDDTRNICRIAYNIIKDGNDIWQNEEFRGKSPINLPFPKEIAESIAEIKRLHNEKTMQKLCQSYESHKINP